MLPSTSLSWSLDAGSWFMGAVTRIQHLTRPGLCSSPNADSAMGVDSWVFRVSGIGNALT